MAHWPLVHSSSVAHVPPVPFLGWHVEVSVSQYAVSAQSPCAAHVVLHAVAPHA
jgi:hypothetical protein